VIKKIAHERLTALLFREECIVTACQDGYVCTWARPNHVGQNGPVSPGGPPNDGQNGMDWTVKRRATPDTGNANQPVPPSTGTVV